MKCEICPRKCKADRKNKFGFCGEGDKLKVALHSLHKFEEPIISGGEVDAGSGTIFFSGCNMRCAFCQNYEISAGHLGEIVSADRLVEMMKELECRGALNINFVTPTHFTRQIKSALDKYHPNIPIVWNSNGYENAEEIVALKGYVDIFLVDLKYAEDDLAMRYSAAPNYFETAKQAIKRMREIVPNDIIENGIMKKGLIVRQLVLPNNTTNSIKCLEFIKNELGADTIVSIMGQYTPMFNAKNFPEISRRLTPLEYKRVVNYAIKNNMLNCFTQDLTSATSIYTPNFKKHSK